MSLNRYILFFIAFTIILVAASWFLKDFLELSAYFIPKYWVIFGFMGGVTLIVYMVSWIGIKRGGESQVLITLGAIVIRLLSSLLIILFYLMNFKVDPVIFIINFFSIYFLFTVFEISCLLVNLRHQIKK